MKTALRYFLAAFLIFIGIAFAFADDFKSQFISPSQPCPSCPIHVDDEQSLLIRNFTQDSMVNTRGAVTFQRHGGSIVTVLTASIVDPLASPGSLEVINSVVIAGPATVNVSCGDATTGCFFSYKKQDN